MRAAGAALPDLVLPPRIGAPIILSAIMPHVPSRTEIIELRGLQCCVRHWGTPSAPRLLFLHGRMDASATFQFVVDALQQPWHVIAPDWRGYGASA